MTLVSASTITHLFLGHRSFVILDEIHVDVLLPSFLFCFLFHLIPALTPVSVAEVKVRSSVCLSLVWWLQTHVGATCFRPLWSLAGNLDSDVHLVTGVTTQFLGASVLTFVVVGIEPRACCLPGKFFIP